MDDGFIAKPLAKRQIDQAYPLVRAVAPGLDVERWRAFAAALIRHPGPSVAPSGIMTAQNGHGYIHGLFSYTLDQHLHHGPILAVENFIVLDLFDPAAAAETLLRAMDMVAKALGCTAIHTNLPGPRAAPASARGDLLDRFREEGHAPEALRLCKQLERANDNNALGTADQAR